MYRTWRCRVPRCRSPAEFYSPQTFLSLRCEIKRRLHYCPAFNVSDVGCELSDVVKMREIVAANICLDIGWTCTWRVCDRFISRNFPLLRLIHQVCKYETRIFVQKIHVYCMKMIKNILFEVLLIANYTFFPLVWQLVDATPKNLSLFWGKSVMEPFSYIFVGS